MSAVEGRAEVVSGAANRRDWPAADLGSHFETGRRQERSRDHARSGEAAGCALEASGSLSVSLTAEPSDTTISVHPVVDIGLAVKGGDFSGFSARVLSHDNPVVVRVTDRSEDHFCFCHAALSRHLSQKRIPRAHGLSSCRRRGTPMATSSDRCGRSSRTRITAPSRSAARIRSWASACSRGLFSN